MNSFRARIIASALLFVCANLNFNVKSACAVETEPLAHYVCAIDAAMQLLRTVSTMDEYQALQVQQERFGDVLTPPIKSLVKYSRGRVYVKILEGKHRNAETIYLPEDNKQEVLAHKGSFPDLTLRLSLRGSTLLDGNHHSLDQVGVHYLAQQIRETFQKVLLHGGSQVTCTTFGASGSTRLMLTLPVRLDTHRVEPGEDLWSFTQRVGADPFFISHINGSAKHMKVEAGQALLVSRYYGSKLFLEIDRGTGLPRRIEIYDHKGQLYERYEWLSLLKVPLSDHDFDPKNADYGF